MLVTDLLGKTIRPRHADDIGRYAGPWPVNEPNLSGEHSATIVAAWVEDGSVKVSAVTSTHVAFDTYVTNVKVFA